MVVVGVCEDDVALRGVLVSALRGAGHDVVVTSNGEQATRLLGKDSGVQVCVIDIGLPDADGRDVCLALRASGQQAPVLFLTALGAVHERLAGFHAGGDDYLTKPFSVSELLVRIEALSRRAATSSSGEAGLQLDAGKHAITFGAQEVRLSPTEFRLFATIAGRAGEVVRRGTLVAAGWPDGAMVSDNTLDSYIRRLRTKLEGIDAPVGIETVRGVGYTLR
jgi:two-component system OmpR family response regulator